MKTLELMECLLQEERTELEALLKAHRRKSIHRLFKTLWPAVQKGVEPDNEALFEKVFEKPYQKESDYLLRNELRLLNREIELFLQEKEILRRIRKDEMREITPVVVWLELLLERQQLALFEKEWRRIDKSAREKQDFSLLYQLCNVYLNFIYRYQELHVDLYRRAFELLENTRHQILLSAEEDCRMLDVKRSYVHRILKAFDSSFEVPFEASTLKPLNTNEDVLLFRYLKVWSQTYLVQDKIPLYEQLLEWQPTIVRLRPELGNNEFVFLNNLALLYMHESKNYQKANHYFSQAMANHQQNHKRINVELFFNYLINLTRLKRFSEVILHYQSHAKMVEADLKLRFKFCYLVAMNHLLLGQTSEALALIPEDLRQRPRQEYIYTRFMYTIAYCIDGLYDLFERELQNLYQTIRYKTPEEAGEWSYTLSAFRKFFKIMSQEPNANEKKKKYQAMAEELEKESQTNTAGADNLILLWLRTELTK